MRHIHHAGGSRAAPHPSMIHTPGTHCNAKGCNKPSTSYRTYHRHVNTPSVITEHLEANSATGHAPAASAPTDRQTDIQPRHL
eukprot:366506-Chlamydomonas_euryale.AAC.2